MFRPLLWKTHAFGDPSFWETHVICMYIYVYIHVVSDMSSYWYTKVYMNMICIVDRKTSISWYVYICSIWRCMMFPIHNQSAYNTYKLMGGLHFKSSNDPHLWISPEASKSTGHHGLPPHKQIVSPLNFLWANIGKHTQIIFKTSI